MAVEYDQKETAVLIEKVAAERAAAESLAAAEQARAAERAELAEWRSGKRRRVEGIDLEANEAMAVATTAPPPRPSTGKSAIAQMTEMVHINPSHAASFLVIVAGLIDRK